MSSEPTRLEPDLDLVSYERRLGRSLPLPRPYIDTYPSDNLRESVSTEEHNVTEVEFSTWNRRILGTCDEIRGEQYICVG